MSHNTPVKILITGFGAFPGVQDNPCLHILDAIEQAEKKNKFLREYSKQLKTLQLETVWQKAPSALAKNFIEFSPDIMLHLGYAEKSAGFRLEQLARNLTSQVRDQSSDLPPTSKVITGGPIKLETDLDLQEITKNLHRAELPAIISQNAGTYLCNQIYFYSRNFCVTSKHKRVTSLFVHIPPLRQQNTRFIPESFEPTATSFPQPTKHENFCPACIPLTVGQVLKGVQIILAGMYHQMQ